MSDDHPKPAIPAWQRAPPTPATEDPVSSQPVAASTPTAPTEQTEAIMKPRADPPVAAVASPASTAPVAPPPIDSAKPQSFNAVDVDSFHETTNSASATTSPRTVVAPSVPAASVAAAAPPIITYPEFLVRAHRPPPPITPTRLLNTLYFAGGVAALLYGTSKYLIEPMVAQLQHSRHEFFTHSNSKVDELNERLSKLVSQLPTDTLSNSDGETLEADADAASIASDPSESYYRDVSTQTDVAAPSTTLAQRKGVTITPDDAVTRDTQKLSTLRTHLDGLVSSADATATVARERLDSMHALKHYLDTLTYASAGINVWNSENSSAAGTKVTDDAIEELKREIRGVKGVLLSAKRFPSYATGGRTSSGAIR